MNGLSNMASPVIVPDLALAEQLITLSPEISGKTEFRAGVSSRSRVLVDLPSFAKDSEGRPEGKNFTIDFFLGPGACVDVFYILKEAENVFAKVRYHLKKHATLNVWSYVGGGDFVHLGQEVIFKEEHGFASFRGLTIIGGSSQVYHKVKAAHTVGHCISRQFFKSIVSGKAKSVFESLVSVSKDAAGSYSKQLNKNLILSREARCHSRPELRIQTDDVSAAHGSATGELNPAELFYLRSRGISEEQARFMMIEGFAAEIVDEVSYALLQDSWRELVKKRTAELIVQSVEYVIPAKAGINPIA